MSESIPKIGVRGIIRPGHVWAGQVGTVVAHERVPVLNKTGAVVELDGSGDCPHGHRCFVFSMGEFRELNATQEARA